MRRLHLSILAICSVLILFGSLQAKTESHRSSSSSSQKSVHVRSYTRKDGTVVREHTRSYPGQRSPSHQTRPIRSAPPLHDRYSTARNIDGRITRSPAAKDAFKRQHPCPSNGRPAGPCPGYVIDHVKPLACGGADAPNNMQWQTIAEGKAKDRVERIGCK
jgi:hypothetical protein